jgi:hypothetical protein
LADTGERPQAAADCGGIDQRPVTADHPGLLQPADLIDASVACAPAWWELT